MPADSIFCFQCVTRPVIEINLKLQKKKIQVLFYVNHMVKEFPEKNIFARLLTNEKKFYRFITVL